MQTSDMQIVFIPGNGWGDTRTGFFAYLKEKFESLGFRVISPGVYPDPEIGRESVWISYLESLGLNEKTILIGHSTGAICAMRYAENHKILGSVLISTYHTDMGIQSEKDAEYFNTPWDWEAIKNNQDWIIQFNTLDDPFIPIEEARFVHEKLQTIYYEQQQGGHYYPLDEFPDVVSAIKEKLDI